MNEALQRRVWRRARDCCEYCLMPQEYDETAFEIDHVIAKKHDGPTADNNLCLSCFFCNSFKGANIAGRDRKTRKLTPLFNPRRQSCRCGWATLSWATGTPPSASSRSVISAAPSTSF